LLIGCYSFTGDRIEEQREYQGREVYGYPGEDQGQTEKGKPSKLDSYLILVLIIACFINFYETA
jgi:hypothetical protein